MRWIALLLVAALAAQWPMAAGQSGEAEWKQSDATNDVHVTGGPAETPALPGNPPADALDISSLKIEDMDGESLMFTLTMKSPLRYEPPNRQAPSDYPTGSVLVVFQIPGTTAQGELKIFLDSTVAENVYWTFVYGISACARENPSSYYCAGQYRLPFTIVDGSLVVAFPKVVLVRSPAATGSDHYYRPAQNLPLRLKAGDELTKIQVTAAIAPLGSSSSSSGGSLYPALRMEDQAPDGAEWPPFKLRYPSSVPDLQLNTTYVGAIAGEENLIQVALKNLGDRKRLIKLTADVPESEVPGWKVSVTPNVTVAPRNDTTILLRLTPPASESGAATTANVRIRASIVSENFDQASLMLRFTASPPLGADTAKFYFHTRFYSTSDALYDQSGSLSGGSLRVSRLETDPRSEDKYGIGFYGTLGSQGSTLRAFDYLDERIPNPVRFVPGGSVTSKITLDSPAAMDGKLGLRLTAGFMGSPLAILEKTVSVPAGKTEIDLSGPVLPGMERLSPGDGLYIEVTFTTDSPIATVASFGPRLKMVPKVSWFELPVTRDLEREQSIKGLHVILAPANDQDLNDFIKPGRNQIIEMDLRNEEPTPQRVEVIIQNVTDDWKADVLPGPRFNLKANESAHIGIRFIAPAHAKEESHLNPIISVRSTEDQKVHHTLRVTLTVASSIEGYENETFRYAAEDQGKLDIEPKGNSPAASFVCFLAALGAVAVALRRRPS